MCSSSFAVSGVLQARRGLSVQKARPVKRASAAMESASKVCAYPLVRGWTCARQGECTAKKNSGREGRCGAVKASAQRRRIVVGKVGVGPSRRVHSEEE